MLLPTEVDANWYVSDFRTINKRGRPPRFDNNNDGMTFELDRVPDDELWLVTRVIATAHDGLPSDLAPPRFLKNLNAQPNFIGVAVQAVAATTVGYYLWEPPQPVHLPGGDNLLVRWVPWQQSGQSTLNFTTTVQYTVLRRAS